MKRLGRELGPPLVGVAGLLIVWSVVAAFAASNVVPSPAEVWSAFVHGMSDGTIPEATSRR